MKFINNQIVKYKYDGINLTPGVQADPRLCNSSLELEIFLKRLLELFSDLTNYLKGSQAFLTAFVSWLLRLS